MPFDQRQFLDHLGNVDKDYRLMALFDLMKSLKSGEPYVVPDCIITSVIEALTDTDGQVRNDAVSVFPLLVCTCRDQQQETIFAHLLSGAAAQVAWFGSKDFSENADLCAIALKRSTTAIAETCQRSVEKWQMELSVVLAVLTQAVAELNKSIAECGRENVYAAILCLTSPFAATWPPSLRASLVECAMADFSTFPGSRRLTGTCIAMLLPFTDAETFATIQKFMFNGLEGDDEKSFPAYLQLCGEGFASDSYRLRSSAPRLIDTLLMRLRTVASGAEEPTADTELLTVGSLLNTYRAHLRSKWADILDVCHQICSVGVSAAPASDAGGYGVDEYYEDDYYGATTDDTWKARREALRVVTTLAALSEEESFGAQALAIAGQGVCDAFEEVQVESLEVIQTIAKKPYAASPQIIKSLVDLCPSLLYFLHFEGKTFIPALGCVESFFCCDTDASSFAPHITRNLEEALANTPNRPPHRADLVRVACRVLESVLTSPSPTVHKYARSLSLSLIESTTAETHSKAIQQCLDAAELFIAANRLFPDAQIGLKALAMYDSICTSSDSDAMVRNSIVSAAGRWCVACEFPQAVAQALTVLHHCAAHDNMCATVLTTLGGCVASTTCVRSLQTAPILKDVVDALLASQPATCQMACECITALLRAGVTLDSQLTETVLVVSEKSVADCLCPVLRMCSAYCEQNPQSATRIYQNVLLQVWDQVSSPRRREEYAFEPSSSVDTFAGACATVSKCSETLRSALGQRVLESIEKCVGGNASTSCVLVRGVAVADDAFTVNFVTDLQRRLSQNRANWLLALGEVARVVKLSSAHVAELVSSVGDPSSERIRGCGRTALSLALPNPANSDLLKECVRCATASDAKGPVYLFKAIRTAALQAVGMTSSCFHDAKLCLPLMETLLFHQSDDADIDAVGGCLGSMACFFPDAALNLFRSAAEKNRPSADKNSTTVHIVCASAARFILTSTSDTKTQLAVKSLVQLLFPDFTRDYDVPLRQALARLFSAVAHKYPVWLCCDEFKSAFAGLIVDLIPCAKLVGSLKIGNYTHLTDRGLELRVQTFECISALFDADERKGTGILAFVDLNNDLLNALIQECGSNGSSGSTGTAETDKTISDRAKRLLIRFFRMFPDAEPTNEQIAQLCSNLDVNLDVPSNSGAAIETRDGSTVQSISLIYSLGKYPCFAHNTAFQSLTAKTVQSPFLADALALN